MGAVRVGLPTGADKKMQSGVGAGPARACLHQLLEQGQHRPVCSSGTPQLRSAAADVWIIDALGLIQTLHVPTT
jgi:hypothetical protein